MDFIVLRHAVLELSLWCISARRGCLYLLSCLDDPLVLHVEVDLWDFRDPSVKLQLFLPLLPLLDICIGSWMLHNWLTVAFPLQCVSPRNSPGYFASLGHSPLVCFACCWLCSSLACCWLCSSACCWLCSSRR